MFNRSKKIIEQQAELIAAYRNKIDILENAPKEKEIIPVSFASLDMNSYQESISRLSNDKNFLSMLFNLKRAAVDAFTAKGKESPEYYRGQIAAFNTILSEISNVKSTFISMQDIEAANE